MRTMAMPEAEAGGHDFSHESAALGRRKVDQRLDLIPRDT